jgi:hypothetical protein
MCYFTTLLASFRKPRFYSFYGVSYTFAVVLVVSYMYCCLCACCSFVMLLLCVYMQATSMGILQGRVTRAVPASIIQGHTVFIDEAEEPTAILW